MPSACPEEAESSAANSFNNKAAEWLACIHLEIGMCMGYPYAAGIATYWGLCLTVITNYSAAKSMFGLRSLMQLYSAFCAALLDHQGAGHGMLSYVLLMHRVQS